MCVGHSKLSGISRHGYRKQKAKCGTAETAVMFHNTCYAIFVCKGYLVMRQLGQLEMRQSRLSTYWSMSTLGARM
jgi:hypothetical protein